MKGFVFMCCECKLVHDITFRRRNTILEIKMTRDERATAAARRKRR